MPSESQLSSQKRSWKQSVWAWLLLTTAVVALYAPTLLGGRIFFDFDTFTEGYAYATHFSAHPGAWMSAAYTNAYHSGANLVFNPDVQLFGGIMTLMPQGASDLLLWNVLTFGFFLFAAFLTYAFFRAQGFNPWLAVALTTAVLFSQRLLLTFSAWIWVALFAVFPGFCLALKRYAEDGRWWWVGVGGGMTAFTILFAQPGGAVLFIPPLLAYVVFLFVRTSRKQVKDGWRFLVGLIGMAAIGLLLSGWYLLPTMRMAQDTPRAQGIDFVAAQTEILYPGDAIRLFLPEWTFQASGEGALYMSFIAVAFALLSFARPTQHSEEKFWRWLILGCILFAIPGSPLAWAANQLPILESARNPVRILFVATFGIALLAGWGIDTYCTQAETVRKKRFTAVIRWLIIVFLGTLVLGSLFDLFGGFAWITRMATHYFDTHLYAQTTGLPLEHYHRVLATMVENIARNFRWNHPITLIVIGSAVAMCTSVWRRRPYQECTIAWALIASSIAFGIATAWPLQTVSVSLLDTTPAAAQFIHVQENAHLFRVFTVFFGSSKFEFLDTPAGGNASPEDQLTYGRDLMAVNTTIHAGVQSIDGYDNFMTRRTANLLNEVGSEAMPYGEAMARADISRAEKINILNDRLNVLGAMNVKWLLSAYELPTSTLRVVWTGETTSRHIPIVLYENPLALSRVYLANAVTVIPENEQSALTELLRPGRDFQAETLLECTECFPEAERPIDTEDTATLVAYAPGDVTVRTTTGQTRLLVFTENRLRGWRVTLDGMPVPTYFTNYLFQGVRIPPGEHEVRFHYGTP